MDALKAFLAKDMVKLVGALLGIVAGVLVTQFPPPHVVGSVSAIVFAVLASLGLVSGGTSNLRSDASRAAATPPPPAP